MPRRKCNQEPTAQYSALVELRMLAGLELKKRQLRRELAEVLEQYHQLSLEIKSKKIPIPWLPYGCRD